MLDIVRGNNNNPLLIKELIIELNKIYNETELSGTLYIGYPLIASNERKITVDSLLISEKFGLIAFIFTNELNPKTIMDEQDNLYYNLKHNFTKYENLRSGRELSFNLNIVTIVPTISNIEIDNSIYMISTTDSIKNIFMNTSDITNDLYSLISECVQKISTIKPKKKRDGVQTDTYGGIMKSIEKEIANLDRWQKKAAMEIPDGPQRIRGLAGSGKTIVLALKAAYIHSENYDAKIAVTFYTRSLSQQYKELIRKFYQEFTGDEPNWNNLKIIHAWGNNTEVGLYSLACSQLGITPHSLNTAKFKYGKTNAFEGICNEIITSSTNQLQPEFDFILIDEAQDMPKSFFKLAYEFCREPKKIVWGYDELQNLNDIDMPTLDEMFGLNEEGELKINLETTDDEAQRDIVLPVCYRNPPWILVLAHALGFGIYRKPRLVQMFNDFKLWEKIGYRLKSGLLDYGKPVILERMKESSPKYFDSLIKPDDAIITKKFNSKKEQYEWVANQIKEDITKRELEPDDILVIFPDVYYCKSDYADFRIILNNLGISSSLAGVNTDRDTFKIENHVIASSIYRAKGNEAPMVYIVNSEFCAESLEIIKVRNILFTSITRSRGWVRICGVGNSMNLLEDEINDCITNDFKLNFTMPTEVELEKMRKLNKDKSEKQKKKVTEFKASLQEILKEVEDGEIDLEGIPEIGQLLLSLKKNRTSDENDF